MSLAAKLAPQLAPGPACQAKGPLHQHGFSDTASTTRGRFQRQNVVRLVSQQVRLGFPKGWERNERNGWGLWFGYVWLRFPHTMRRSKNIQTEVQTDYL